MQGVECLWECGLPGNGSLDANLAQFGPIAVPLSGAARLGVVSSEVIAAQRSVSVLGRYPAYVQLGESIPSRFFNVPAWV